MLKAGIWALWWLEPRLSSLASTKARLERGIDQLRVSAPRLCRYTPVTRPPARSPPPPAVCKCRNLYWLLAPRRHFITTRTLNKQLYMQLLDKFINNSDINREHLYMYT